MTIGGACTSYQTVSISAPKAGTVMVTGQVSINLDHTQGSPDLVTADLGRRWDDCGNSTTEYDRLINPNQPTSPVYQETATMIHYYTVPKAGLYTYYENAHMANGQNPGDQFRWGTMTVVFFPNP